MGKRRTFKQIWADRLRVTPGPRYEETGPGHAGPDTPPLTQQPWKIIGTSKSNWYRLLDRPQPVEMGLPGEHRRSYYRVADLLGWLKRLPPRRRKRRWQLG